MNELTQEIQEIKTMAEAALAQAEADRQRLARQEAGVIRMHTEPKDDDAAPTETKADKPVSLKRAVEATEEDIRVLKERRVYMERTLAGHEAHLKSLHEELLADELKAAIDECKDTDNYDERLILLARLVRDYMHSDLQTQVYKWLTCTLEFDEDEYESDSGCIMRLTYKKMDEERVCVIKDDGDVFPENRRAAPGFNLMKAHPRNWDF